MTAASALSAASGYRATTSANPAAAPTICAATNGATDAGAIPAKLSENIRPTVTAGLANEVELVNQ